VAVDQFLEIKEFAKDYSKLERHPFRLGGAARDSKIAAKPTPGNNGNGLGQAKK
jgi:hypothetical protein